MSNGKLNFGGRLGTQSIGQFACQVGTHFMGEEGASEKLDLTVGIICSCAKCGFQWEVHFPYGLPRKVEKGKSRRLYTRCPNGCRVRH